MKKPHTTTTAPLSYFAYGCAWRSFHSLEEYPSLYLCHPVLRAIWPEVRTTDIIEFRVSSKPLNRQSVAFRNGARGTAAGLWLGGAGDIECLESGKSGRPLGTITLHRATQGFVNSIVKAEELFYVTCYILSKMRKCAE